MYFNTQYSESARNGSKQTIKGPSMTEPDNAMSIPEIIARFTRGAGIQVQQHPWQVNDGSELDVADFADMPGGDIVSKEVADPAPPPAFEPATPPAPADAGA